MSNVLNIWTLYDNPKDMPGLFVLRRFEVSNGGWEATQDIHQSHDIESLRERMRQEGLTCIPRNPLDEDQIVESWL